MTDPQHPAQSPKVMVYRRDLHTLDYPFLIHRGKHKSHQPLISAILQPKTQDVDNVSGLCLSRTNKTSLGGTCSTENRHFSARKSQNVAAMPAACSGSTLRWWSMHAVRKLCRLSPSGIPRKRRSNPIKKSVKCCLLLLAGLQRDLWRKGCSNIYERIRVFVAGAQCTHHGHLLTFSLTSSADHGECIERCKKGTFGCLYKDVGYRDPLFATLPLPRDAWVPD